jgi:hypothetical protein
MPSTGEWIQIGTLFSVFLSLFVSYRNSLKIQEVHLSINSRMDQLLKATGMASHAAGLAEGQDVVRGTIASPSSDRSSQP